LGFLVGPEGIIEKLRNYQLPWSVNALALAAGHFLFDEKHAADLFVQETRTYVRTAMQDFSDSLGRHALLRRYPSTTPFLLAKLPDSLNAAQVCDWFSRKKILLRNCDNFKGLSDRFIRVSLKQTQINRRVATELGALLGEMAS
jgi:threonine-phosphate decarboxylase